MHSKPTIDRTAAGEQYVIPGAERRLPPRPRVFPSDGAQLVIPGAERIGTGELLRRRIAEPIAPRRGQRAIGTSPLFRRP